MNPEKFNKVIELDREITELEDVREKLNRDDVRLSYVYVYRDGDCKRIIYNSLKPLIEEAHNNIKQQIDKRLEELKQTINDL